MDIFFMLSIIQLVMGLGLFVIGTTSKLASGHENKRIFFNKMKNQGILNIVLGVISTILQYLNEDLLLISVIIFAVGILFSFIYLIINLILFIKKSSISKNNKIILIIGVILVPIFMFFGELITDELKVGFRKFKEPITVGKEFLLYECDNILHGDEKVYMSINKIEKDNGSCVGSDETICTVMYFDLRYEGDKQINLVDGKRSFSDLSSFTTTLSCDKLKDDHWDDFVIEEDIDSGVIHTEYADKLPEVIKPGEIIKNITYPLAVMGVGYDNISVEDINIQIETGLKMQHTGKDIRENINK